MPKRLSDGPQEVGIENKAGMTSVDDALTLINGSGSGSGSCGIPTVVATVNGRTVRASGRRRAGYFQGIGCWGNDCVSIGVDLGGKTGIALILDNYSPSDGAKGFFPDCEAILGYEKDRSLNVLGDEDV